MAFLSYCSNFCRNAPKMVNILDEIFWRLELSKMMIITSKFDQNLITISKFTAFLSYCSNFCQKSAKNDQNFLKIFGEFDFPKSNISWEFGQILPTMTLKKQQSMRRRRTRRTRTRTRTTRTRTRTRTRVILKPCMRRVKIMRTSVQWYKIIVSLFLLRLWFIIRAHKNLKIWSKSSGNPSF